MSPLGRCRSVARTHVKVVSVVIRVVAAHWRGHALRLRCLDLARPRPGRSRSTLCPRVPRAPRQRTVHAQRVRGDSRGCSVCALARVPPLRMLALQARALSVWSWDVPGGRAYPLPSGMPAIWHSLRSSIYMSSALVPSRSVVRCRSSVCPRGTRVGFAPAPPTVVTVLPMLECVLELAALRCDKPCASAALPAAPECESVRVRLFAFSFVPSSVAVRRSHIPPRCQAGFSLPQDTRAARGRASAHWRRVCAYPIRAFAHQKSQVARRYRSAYLCVHAPAEPPRSIERQVRMLSVPLSLAEAAGALGRCASERGGLRWDAVLVRKARSNAHTLARHIPLTSAAPASVAVLSHASHVARVSSPAWCLQSTTPFPRRSMVA